MSVEEVLEKVPFGLADITFYEDDEAETPLSYNGKDNFQAEGAELTITPSFADITLADFGESIIDQRITGYSVSLSFAAAAQEMETMRLALSHADVITDSVTGKAVGMMDAKLGSSIRKKARKVVIHPRSMGADKSLDVTIYKAAANGDFTRTFANEQGNVAVSMTAYPRDGMDASEPGNFWFIGEVDPHE